LSKFCRIVYVSCNPQTLARDVKIFIDLGFNPSEVKPFDLFPMTGHVESVVCLTHTFDVDMRH
jgi:23S rRNA (uracil1939-C5)-methyltransferase